MPIAHMSCADRYYDFAKATHTNKGSHMINFAGKLAATIVVAASIGSFANVATAAPATGALALKNAVPTTVELVQWRRRGYGYGGVGAGFIAGAIIGGALAAPYYGYGYGPGPITTRLRRLPRRSTARRRHPSPETR